jgi:hypothetical protein
MQFTVRFWKVPTDPNLTYAMDLVKKMGLKPDGSTNPDAGKGEPVVGAANDGDGDTNFLIAGAGCLVTLSDSLAIYATTGRQLLISTHWCLYIVSKPWAKYGHHFYCCYDLGGVDSDAVNGGIISTVVMTWGVLTVMQSME